MVVQLGCTFFHLMSFPFPLHHLSIYRLFSLLILPFDFCTRGSKWVQKAYASFGVGALCNSCRGQKVIAPYTVVQRSSCACTIVQNSAWPYNLSAETCTSSDTSKFEVHVSDAWIHFPSSDIKLIFRIFSQTLPLFRISS